MDTTVTAGRVLVGVSLKLVQEGLENESKQVCNAKPRNVRNMLNMDTMVTVGLVSVGAFLKLTQKSSNND